MAWWKTAKPGDKVVCVDADMFPEKSPLIKGRRYTVLAIFVLDEPAGRGAYAGTVETVVVEEVCNIHSPQGGFSVRRFRPVQENKKSTEAGVAALRRHLVGKTVEVV